MGGVTRLISHIMAKLKLFWAAGSPDSIVFFSVFFFRDDVWLSAKGGVLKIKNSLLNREMFFELYCCHISCM